jgi:hypothetical protein
MTDDGSMMYKLIVYEPKGTNMRRIYMSALALTLLIPALIAAEAPAGGRGPNSPEAKEAAARYAAADIRVMVPGIIYNAGLLDLAAAYTKETGKKVAVTLVGMGSIVNAVKTANPPADVITLPFELMSTLSLDGGIVPGSFAPLGRSEIEAAGLRIRAQIIWAKQHFALSRGDYHWQHEPCWYAVREGKSSNWSGDRTQSTLWQVANLNPIGGSCEEPATGHGTQKPVELMRRPILNHTARGDVVYDPFLGSGTTLIAAELTERVCYGLDIDSRYVDVIVTRWQKLSGKQATLDADGRSFDETAAERIQAAVEV